VELLSDSSNNYVVGTKLHFKLRLAASDYPGKPCFDLFISTSHFLCLSHPFSKYFTPIITSTFILIDTPALNAAADYIVESARSSTFGGKLIRALDATSSKYDGSDVSFI